MFGIISLLPTTVFIIKVSEPLVIGLNSWIGKKKKNFVDIDKLPDIIKEGIASNFLGNKEKVDDILFINGKVEKIDMSLQKFIDERQIEIINFKKKD